MVAEFDDFKVRVLEQKSGELGISPEMHSGIVFDLLELVYCYYDDVRSIIRGFVFFWRLVRISRIRAKCQFGAGMAGVGWKCGSGE